MEPFRIAIPDAAIDDLHDRLERTRWPAQLDGGWDVGPPLDHVRALADHWRTGYDWRAWEARLNAHPQFTTTIDGARVHLLHVRSRHEDALPLVLTHGWPGSIVEFLELIGPLTDPPDPADAFHVVIPSLPGYGFSGQVPGGWDPARIARAWRVLMAELGYERYGAQGGDWGAVVSRELGRIDAGHCAGVHLNMVFGQSRVDDEARAQAAPGEVERHEAARARYATQSGYMHIQSRRPMSIAYGLTDSPAAQLAWIAEQFQQWTAEPVDRDVLLTNVSIYWFTGTAGSSARLYHEAARGSLELEPSRTPTAAAVFPEDLSSPIRAVAERTDHIVRWTTMPRGGHFAALEEPELLLEDVRAFFRDLRR
jgi:epoxide hydrolase